MEVIKFAQLNLPPERDQRRELVGLVVKELQYYRRRLRFLALDRVSRLDMLIGSMSIAIADIAEMRDAEFREVLNELATLMSVLDTICPALRGNETLH